MVAVKASEFVRETLLRKSAGQGAADAVIWGSFNFVLLAVIFGDLQVGGFSTKNVMVWWCGVVVCSLCIINIIYHLKTYITPTFSFSPLHLNEKQRILMAVSQNDIGFKESVPKATTSTPVRNKDVSFSDMFEATIRTPAAHLNPALTATPHFGGTPINQSAGSWAPTPATSHKIGTWSDTPINTSAGSWAPTPYAQSSIPWNMTTLNHSAGSWAPNTMNSSSSWLSGSQHLFSPVSSNSPLDFSLASSSCSPGVNESGVSMTSVGSAAANSWSFHRNHSFFDSSYNFLNSPLKNVGRGSPGSVDSSPMGALRAGGNKATPNSSKMFPIHSKDDLDKYLNDYQQQEKKQQMLTESEGSSSVNSSLWMYSGSPLNQIDFTHMLQKNVYQVATTSAGDKPSSLINKNEDPKTTTLSSYSVSKIWQPRGVLPQQLFQFEENLRIWLSSNILVPLVASIDKTNVALAAVDPELQIGSVGVDKLKKAAQNTSGLKQLYNLLPFLELTLHQDYLVERLRQLSRGGAISAYQWDGGSSFNGKQWWDEYPTDTLVLLHLFAKYMDTQLPPDPTQPDGRVFSNVHLVKTPEKPPKPTSNPVIFLTQVSPPHLKVVLPGDDECEFVIGHKNFLHSLLLFCHHLTHQQHSHIAGINLNMSGINLAWVVTPP